MRVSTKVRSAALMAMLLGGIGACADSPTALSSRPTADGSLAADVFYGTSVAVTLDPTQNQTLKFGPHYVVFPANSICDPLTSGYGEALWDAPCSPLRTPIVITATYSLRNNHALIDFQPALRFVPAAASDTSSWVVMTLKEPQTLSGSSYAILWQRPSDGKWIDESVNDPSLKAFIDRPGNFVSRRLKHFSGYNVTAGFMDTVDSGLGGLTDGSLLLDTTTLP
jgi:hypothetical protein